MNARVVKLDAEFHLPQFNGSSIFVNMIFQPRYRSFVMFIKSAKSRIDEVILLIPVEFSR